MIDPGRPAPPLPRLTEASRALTYARSLEEILEITVDCAIDLLGASKALFLLLEDGELRIVAARGVDPQLIERFREPLDERLSTRLAALLGPEAEHGFLGVPLVVRGSVTGVLAVLRPEPADTGETEEWLLSALADQASIAVEGSRFGGSQEALQTRVAELERRSSASSRALQVLGHDLRSPLSAMLGYLELLASGVYGTLDQPQREAVARIQMIGRHLGSVLQDVTEMNKLAAGKIPIRSRFVRLVPVVEDTVAIVGPAADEKGIRVRTEVPADLGGTADPDRLRQVLLHLLDNAVKYSPGDTAVRVLGERAEDDAGEWTLLRVSDEGPGIAEEEREAIFEPYRRGEAAAAVQGSGLGLAIARSLCDRMGGSLTLESEMRAGTTFVVRLPRGEPPRPPG